MTGYAARIGTTVQATCWCEARTVRIPVDWVGERTASCGATECTAIELRKSGEN